MGLCFQDRRPELIANMTADEVSRSDKLAHVPTDRTIHDRRGEVDTVREVIVGIRFFEQRHWQ